MNNIKKLSKVILCTEFYVCVFIVSFQIKYLKLCKLYQLKFKLVFYRKLILVNIKSLH